MTIHAIPTRAARQLLLSLALGTAALTAQAAEPATLLHAMFQDHAVLQRDAPIRVYGQAAPGEQISIAFAGKRAKATADAAGHWEAQLPKTKAGGPYTLTASAGEVAQTVNDVLVGDVWLCAGQSNMELQVWRTLDARAEIAGASNDRIRLLTVPQVSSPVPLPGFSTPTRWQPVNSDSVRDFSAACYYFARELQKTVDVPMGLINASWGGSRIQAWTSGDALRTTGVSNEDLDVLSLYASDPAAAARRWGEVWTRWWNRRAGAVAGDEPWRPDYQPGTGWRDAPRALGAWERWGVPELAEFDGMMWYRNTVTLTPQQAAQDAVLQLGAADEMDMTWVNGHGVGSTYGAGDKRQYALPKGLLHAGENTVVVNVLDTYREGGLAGPADAHALRLKDGTTVPLATAWKVHAVQGHDGPPRAPWQSAAGLSTLYNGMIAPLGRYGLRGMLWYQGESNTAEGERYGDMLALLRSDWRDRFGANLPMLVVQLANYGMPKSQPAESGWAQLREAQRLAVAEDAHSALAVAIDIGDRYDIHPSNKQELGRRLARAARHVVYGEKLPASGPVPVSARREGDAVTLDFADVTGSLVAYGARGPVGFELCGAQADSCRYADATINGNRVALRGAATDATRVRYCWADSPVCTLFDGAGLPAGPFEAPIQ